MAASRILNGACLAAAFCLVTSLALAIDPPSTAHETTEPGPLGGHDAHGDAQGVVGHHPELNWAHGFLGVKEGVEPSFAYRPVGMAPPLLAQFLNTALLFGLIYALGKKPIAEALKKRKSRIVSGMEEAGRMRDEAAASLASYEKKLKHIEEEIDRVRREMKESAEADRHRILQEAKERRDRMERDAKRLVEQELEAAREQLMRETVRSAVRSAEQMITQQLTASDEDRMAKLTFELLGESAINSGGGRA